MLHHQFSQKEFISILGFLLLLAAGSFLGGNYLAFSRGLNATGTEPMLSKMIQAYHLIPQVYVTDVDRDTLIIGALDGMTASLQDEFSYYVNEAELQDIEETDAHKADFTFFEDRRVGLITVRYLGSAFREQLPELVSAIQKDTPKALIIDLRDVSGGRNDADIALLEALVMNGEILRVVYKNQGDEVVTTDGEASLSMFPTVVLVNNKTGSAAEVVAAALQDHKKATIMGEPTYGKGTMQGLYGFQDGSGLNLTEAKWLRPSGGSVSGVGVLPDQEVMDDPTTEHDEVLETALEFLQAK